MSDPYSSNLCCSDCKTSDSASLTRTSRLRPTGSALTVVRYANWDPERAYDGEPKICYNVEWKLFIKNRGQAGESELDLVISTRKFWKQERRWLTQVRTSLGRRDVTDCKTGKITKRFPKLEFLIFREQVFR